MMPRRADPLRALLRAIAALDIGSVVEASSTPWASGLFTGAQHAIAVCCEDAGARERLAAFIATADEHEWALPGHLVASVAATAVPGGARIDVLTIEGGM